MAKIYFNRPIMKNLPETTVVNYFFQKEGGDSLYIRDTRSDVYDDAKVVFGDIILYQVDGDPHTWNCDIIPMHRPNYDVLGFYVGEGTDFEVTATDEPIFKMRQKEIEMSMPNRADMPQRLDDVTEVTLGLFHPNTTIRYKMDGVEIVDTLTTKGWVRERGPEDDKFGIMSIKEAFDKKIALEEKLKNPSIKREKLLEEIEIIRDAMSRGDISYSFGTSLLSYKTDLLEGRPPKLYYFLAKDVKDLVKKGITFN